MIEIENILRNELNTGEKELIYDPVVSQVSRDSHAELNELEKSIQGCSLCKLHTHRTNLVFGDGNPNAELMFIGEGPGADEDFQGKPFVGRAGKLLDRIIAAMGFDRKDVYIGNIVKCRPPDNRTPEADEILACSPVIFKQIKIIKPKVICCLGLPAAQTILKTNQPMKSLRGKFFNFGGIKVLPTYHPAYVLRNPNIARPLVWEDVQKIMDLFGKKKQ
ncbi:MAG: hypothetical protein A2161_18035 [Candidatus Schekmanbacteria bacterium RBG_13_48_7]|uniref:Type-4 uracil-DNA glycosylase n=1 Tax=Candidatus Schekmanbacteria bacterium RBG_13_48_7 TaxID=1817878 RepID=A0A1F7RJL6_9BACT|nr:MAG: hypothetical protein A2161_18035 [Candidatus Schekmanbacteria bacterium RBG_13_48_7]